MREKIQTALLYISIALLVTITIGVMVQVICRNLLGFSLNFLEELTILLLSYFAFFTTSYTLGKHGHVAVDFITQKFSPKANLLWSNVVDGITILTLGVIAYACIGLIVRQMPIPMTMLPLSKGWLYIGCPVNCLIMMYFLLDDIWQRSTHHQKSL
ncbi:MAG: TRAP transporter small permease [Eubacteriales bacterium]|jgi:TRAP-type C4-dicarboxylate transport system permease small subunit